MLPVNPKPPPRGRIDIKQRMEAVQGVTRYAIESDSGCKYRHDGDIDHVWLGRERSIQRFKVGLATTVSINTIRFNRISSK
jgi:hypothetical protein